MKHIVDIETWERKDNYNFFRGFCEFMDCYHQ